MKLDRAMQFLCAGVTLTVAGLGIALLSAVMLAKGYVVQSWPTTSGVIVRSELDVTKKASGFRRSGVSTYSDYYVGKIEYRYTVDGQEHTCDDVGASGGVESYRRDVAERGLAKYPVGQTVTVSYNPKHPEWAVIDRSFSFALWWAVTGIALAVGCSGIYCWLKAIRIDDARRAAERPAAPPAFRQPAASEVPARRRHWALRMIAVLVGLFFFFFGSLLMVYAAGHEPKPGVSRGIWITTIVIMATFAFFGAWLIRGGMSVPRIASLHRGQPTG